jgi:hypothetical protein
MNFREELNEAQYAAPPINCFLSPPFMLLSPVIDGGTT